jgi:hypothetical protein
MIDSWPSIIDVTQFTLFSSVFLTFIRNKFFLKIIYSFPCSRDVIDGQSIDLWELAFPMHPRKARQFIKTLLICFSFFKHAIFSNLPHSQILLWSIHLKSILKLRKFYSRFHPRHKKTRRKMT